MIFIFTLLVTDAMTEIAYGFCPFNAAASFGRPNYKEKCRVVAVGICQGAVGAQVQANGCSITTSELKVLQSKCEGVVNQITGGPFIDDDRFDDDMPTFEPTVKPTRKPSKRPSSKKPSRQPTRK